MGIGEKVSPDLTFFERSLRDLYTPVLYPGNINALPKKNYGHCLQDQLVDRDKE
jgi:hypothetical protein